MERGSSRNGGNSGYSGSGYDRWSYEHNGSGAGNETTLNKLQHKYWVAKQAVARKLGKDEDEHIAASDSELDAKLELFISINETTCDLQRLIEHYQDRLCNLSYEENALGRFLKDYGKADKTKAGKMMVAVGKTMSYSGQQRLSIRVPLVRLYQEVETFRQRAIEDTRWTVNAMEKNRTEYRGSLMWMKKISQELDPDTYKQLEKFRKVQNHVKQSKAKFDKYKLDCLQKVDLLAASRCNMFSHALIMYQNALITFWEKSSKTMTHVNKTFEGYQHYEFSYIKDLADPEKLLSDDTKKDNKKDKKKSADSQKTTKHVDNLLFDLNDASKSEETKNENLLDLSIPNARKDDDELLLDIDDELADDKMFEKMNLMPSGSQTGTSVTDQKSLQLPKIDKDDALLLEELMNGPQPGQPESGFSAQWNQLFGNENNSPSNKVNDDEFGEFTSLTSCQERNNTNTEPNLMSSKISSISHNDDKSFLPSQLFDLNQSLYSKSPTQKGPENLLADFPMPGPLTTSTFDDSLSGTKKGLKKQLSNGSDKSQWFSLFADLDPLSNPDAIGKTTKQEDRNCYS